MTGEPEADSQNDPEREAKSWEQIQSAPATEAPNLSQDDQDRVQDRKLRRAFMDRMVWILVGLLLVVNGGVIVLASCDKVELGETTLSIWLTATLGQAYGIVRVIAINLFPARSSETT